MCLQGSRGDIGSSSGTASRFSICHFRVRTLVIVVMPLVFEEEKTLPIVEEFATFRMESSVRHSQLWLQLADPAITVFTFKSVS
jgi:hypothetical protein